jgi:hypothetical protein
MYHEYVSWNFPAARLQRTPLGLSLRVEGRRVAARDFRQIWQTMDPALGLIFTVVAFFDRGLNHKTNSRVAQRSGHQTGDGKTISRKKETSRQMGSNSKEARLGQKAHWENRLNERLSALRDQGLESGQIVKDSAVKKIRAEIRKAQARLGVIESLEKKAESMAKAKKAAADKKKKTKKEKKAKEAPEISKRQQKKKAKKEKKENEKKTEE